MMALIKTRYRENNSVRDSDLLYFTQGWPGLWNERSFGEPMCLCKYAIRNKTGNQQKFCTE